MFASVVSTFAKPEVLMNTRQYASSSRVWSILRNASLLLGAVLIVVLALEVRALEPQARELRKRRALPYIGQFVPTVRTVSLSGDSVTIGETAKGRSQVLIVFSTKCPYCLSMLDSWKRISAELLADPKHQYDVVWVSISQRDSTLAYIAKHDIKFPVMRMPDSKTLAVYRIKGVPMTLVLDYNGQLRHVHASVFNSKASADSVVTAARQAQTAESSIAQSVDTASQR